MNQYTRTMITFGFLVFILFGLYYFTGWFSRTTGYVLGDNEKLNLAICLKGKEAILYSSNTCPDCEKQLEMFGKEALKWIEVFICQNALECPQGGVPAWKIEGQFYYGVKQLDELIEISGCDIR